MSSHKDSSQQRASVSTKQVKDVGELIGSRKVLELINELIKQPVKKGVASTAYIVSRMYIYSLILHALKYFDFKMSYAPTHGVNVSIMKEVVPFKDGFEIHIKVNIMEIDVKKLKKSWRHISAAFKRTDDDSVKLIMKMGKHAYIEAWKEFEMDHMCGKVGELKEFKVVKEEQINEGENG
jgi:hypothetical protein